MNHLLGSEKPIPFDFLINGAFLQTTVEEFLAARGYSSESTVAVEYVRSILPPAHLASYEHDDWIGAVDALSRSSHAGSSAGDSQKPPPGRERIVSGCYDGHLVVWDMSSHMLATINASTDDRYSAGVKAVKFLTPSQIVSSGLDRVIRLWDYKESSDHTTADSKPRLELYGHRASVDDLDVHWPSRRILSASADHTVGLWTISKADAPAAPEALVSPNADPSTAKRRKLAPSNNTPKRGPISQLRSHSAPVSSVIFAHKDTTVAYSTSWDHTLRTWDLPTASLVDTRTTAHSLLSVCELPALHLLAAGTSARHITLVDPRASATTVSAMTLRGHTNAVVSLARDPNNTFGLVSGSHDGTCRVWDVRSTRPGRAQDSAGVSEGAICESVYTIPRDSTTGKSKRGSAPGQGCKVFDVVWDEHVGIVSAGEDKRLQINKGRDERGS